MEDILPKLGHERGKGSHAMFLMIKRPTLIQTSEHCFSFVGEGGIWTRALLLGNMDTWIRLTSHLIHSAIVLILALREMLR